METAGTHNAFLFTLSNFGVIGYLILFGFLVSNDFIDWFPQKNIGSLQVSLLLGFLLIWIHSFMEDILLAPHWMPIVYSFLGLAFYFRQRKNEEDMKDQRRLKEETSETNKSC